MVSGTRYNSSSSEPANAGAMAITREGGAEKVLFWAPCSFSTLLIVESLLCYFSYGPIPTSHLKQPQLNDQDFQHTFQVGKERGYHFQMSKESGETDKLQ